VLNAIQAADFMQSTLKNTWTFGRYKLRIVDADVYVHTAYMYVCECMYVCIYIYVCVCVCVCSPSPKNEILKAVAVKISVMCHVTPCSLVYAYWRFTGTVHLLRTLTIEGPKCGTRRADSCKFQQTVIFLIFCLCHYFLCVFYIYLWMCYKYICGYSLRRHSCT